MEALKYIVAAFKDWGSKPQDAMTNHLIQLEKQYCNTDSTGNFLSLEEIKEQLAKQERQRKNSGRRNF